MALNLEFEELQHGTCPLYDLYGSQDTVNLDHRRGEGHRVLTQTY